jgi:hypothetical protein
MIDAAYSGRQSYLAMRGVGESYEIRLALLTSRIGGANPVELLTTITKFGFSTSRIT